MSKTINIDGYSNGNTGIEIEIDNLGLEILSIKGKYAAQNKSYIVTVRYKMPIIIKASYNGEVLVQNQYHDNVGPITYTMEKQNMTMNSGKGIFKKIIKIFG